MLRSAKSLLQQKVMAIDAEVGPVHDVFFDDQRWTLRYLAVDTGMWLPGRKVLIAPIALSGTDLETGSFRLNLTRKQIKESPDIDTDKPVCRQQELRLCEHYKWPGPWLWGPIPPPPMWTMAPPDAVPGAMPPRGSLSEPHAAETTCDAWDPHLRSMQEVCGYAIQTRDGEIGRLEDFIMEEEGWQIRHIVIDVRNGLPGKMVLVPPEWIAAVRWETRTVAVSVEREAVKNSPPFDPAAPVNRQREAGLFDYYGRPCH